MQMTMGMYLEERKTKRDMILELYLKGMSRKDIARELKTYYNYVSGVIREYEYHKKQHEDIS
jgi:transcriptional regulator